VTVILQDDLPEDAAPDPAFGIPDLAQDIVPEELSRNLEHYLYGPSKTMNSSSTNLVYVDAAGWIALVNRRDASDYVAKHIERIGTQFHFIPSIIRCEGRQLRVL
jgi:hypothetical protein